jgi:hypothetical protein
MQRSLCFKASKGFPLKPVPRYSVSLPHIYFQILIIGLRNKKIWKMNKQASYKKHTNFKYLYKMYIMKPRLLLTLITLLLIGNKFSNAQTLRSLTNHDTLVHVYTLDNEQVEYLYKKGGVSDTTYLFTHPFKQISEKIFNASHLLYGQYITAKCRENKVYIDYVCRLPFSYTIKQIRDDQVVYITDIKKNTVLKNASLIYKNKAYAYDEGYGGYAFQLAKSKNNNGIDTIRVKYNNVVYILSARYNTNIFKINNSTKPNTRNALSPGYLILTKPKYKLLDTLKFKAFLVNHFNGKPIKNKVTYTLTCDGKIVEQKKLKPITDGAFIYDWKIPDTLKIDKQYEVHLSYSNKGYEFSQQKTFRIEDYELAKNTYEFIIPKDTFVLGEPAQFFAQAKDANGFLLSDAHVNYKLSIENVINTYTDTLIFTDSAKANWYSFDTLLNENNITELTIPENKLPKALIKFKVTASIVDATYEKKDFVNYFYWDATKSKLDFYQQEDSIVVNYYELLKSSKNNYKLLLLKGNDTLKNIMIETPYKINIPYNATSALLYKNDTLKKQLTLQHNYLDFLGLVGKRSADSIHIQFNSSLESPLHYKIYEDDKIIASGESKKLDFKKADNSKKTYYLLVHSNENEQIENSARLFVFQHREQLLHIKTNLPTDIYPGQEIPIEINITDYYNKTVEGANITALGINAQFKNELQKPSIYIPRKQPNEIEIESLNKESETILTTHVLSASNIFNISKWQVDAFTLHRNDYYKICYPKEFVATTTMPLIFNKCEVAIIPIQNGQANTATYVKVDGRMLYYCQAQRPLPYAQTITPGKHTFEVRFLDNLIKLENVECKPNAKTIISFVNDSLISTSYKKYVIEDSLPIFSITEEEFSAISKSYFYYNKYFYDTLKVSNYNNPSDYMYYFYQSQIGETQLDGDSHYIVGPFENSKVILEVNHKKVILDKEKQSIYYINDSLKIDKILPFDSYVAQNINSNSAIQIQTLIDTVNHIEKLPETLIPNYDKPTPLMYVKPLPDKYIHALTNTHSSTYSYSTAHFNFMLPDTQLVINIWLINKVNSDKSIFLNVENQHQRNYSCAITNQPYDVIFIYNTGKLFKVKDYTFKQNENWYINSRYGKHLPVNDSTTADYMYLYNSLTQEPQQLFINNPDESSVEPKKIQSIKRTAPLLHGIVQNDDNDPIADIELFLEQEGRFVAGAKTNSNGQFEFLNIPQGHYMLKVYDQSYAPKYVYNVLINSNIEYFYTLILDRNNTRQPYFQINATQARILAFDTAIYKNETQATVLDRETREPLADVDITFYYEGKQVYQNRSNKQGNFNLFTTEHPLYLYTMQLYLPNHKRLYLNNIRFEKEESKYNAVFFMKTNGVFDTATEYINAQMLREKVDNIAETEENKYEQSDNGSGIRGQVLDEKKQALDGATVKVFQGGMLKGGCKADINGNYKIEPLEPGIYEIHATFVGYAKRIITDIKVKANNISNINIVLERSTSKTIGNAVIITASRRKLIDVENRGVTSKEQMYSGYGARYSTSSAGSYSTVTLNDQASLAGSVYQMSASPSGISISGGRSDNTLYMIDGVPIRGGGDVRLPTNSMSFKNMNTDESAQLFDKLMNASDATSIRENFNDVGFWVPNLITNKQGKAITSIKIPDNITTWKCYILAMSTDFRNDVIEHNIRSYKPLITTSIIPRFMYANDVLEAKARITNFDASERNIKIDLSFDGLSLLNKNINIKKSYLDSVKITAPKNKDSVTWLSTLDYDAKYTDGEKIKIPVFSTALKTVEYDVVNMDKDSSYKIEIPSTSKATLYFNNKVYETILSHIETLKNYEFGCMEQNSSKLKALLIEKSIIEKLNQPFKGNNFIQKLIRQIEKSQNTNGSFGWWAKSNDNVRMTCYVSEVLQMASNLGYPTSALLYATDYLERNAKKMSTSDKLYAMYILKLCNKNNSFKDELEQMDYNQLPAHDKLYYMLCEKMYIGNVSTNKYFNWLTERRENSRMAYSENFFHDPMANLLMSFHIFKGTSNEAVILKNIKPLIDNQNVWRRSNTYSKAYLLEAWLYNTLKDSNNNVNATLTINDTLTVNTFPYTMKSNGGTFTIKHQGAKVFNTTTKTVEIETPTKQDSIFQINTSFMQNAKVTSTLQRGEKTTLVVNLRAFKSKQQVMVEIPIPSSCTFNGKPKASGLQEHIEYYKNKVIIYYNVLPLGEHTISIPLNTIFSGVCQVPATKASLMYYPFVSGNNENGVVESK